MSILPTWPIAAGALVIGLAVGAYADHKIMQGRIDKITIAHTEELRVREVKRANDERAERDKEQDWIIRYNQVEQRRMKTSACVLSLLLLLPACSSAPIASPPQQVEAARPPPLAKQPLGPSYLDQMQNFLSGLLSEQTNKD